MSRITEALEIAGFPEDAKAYFEEIYLTIEANKELHRHLLTSEACYYENGDYAAEIKQLAEKSGLHLYTVEMLHLLYCVDRLKDIYQARGYSEELLEDSMADLRYKLEECKAVHGIWGTFVFWWFKRFYECKTFKLGRLEFEWEELEFDYDETLKKGASVINCHIPSAGPLHPELVEEALAKAYEFYGFAERREIMPVVCESWMLYPPHYEQFPNGGNMRTFFDRFKVYKHWEDAKNEDAWRIFNRADHDYESFPQDTELRRNFYRYLNDGKKMGSGYGILFYHSEMERINRITKMEHILDTAIKTSQISGQDLKLLTEYYEGPLWREDFEADEAGRLPKDLKRGVLSEDAVYNLLEELREVRERKQ